MIPSSRLLFTLLASSLALQAAGDGKTTSADDKAILQKAKQIHRKIVTFDSHVDVPVDLDAAADGKSQFDLVKVERGHLSGAALAVFVPQAKRTPENYQKARADADAKYETIVNVAKRNPNRAALAYSPADVRNFAKQGKFAVVISFLNAFPLGKDLSQIDTWYDRGVRIFGFSHAGNNDWADSSRPVSGFGDKPDEIGGLSELGRQAVAKLNEKGILIDVSQLSTKALYDTLSITKAPVAATHSAVKGIVDNSRNLSDEELQAIAKNGGVVQIVAFSNYLRPVPSEVEDKVKALRAEYGLPDKDDSLQQSWPVEKQKEYSTRWHAIIASAPKATLAQLVDSVDYAVKKIGVDHVGISSDFNHGGGVIGWDDEGEAENVTVELLRRGYTEPQIAKLWGGNFLRVWSEAQSAGKKLSAGAHRSRNKQVRHA
ncbi:MAG: dipeptidase [Burkholderiaceae bacterium]|jgi:microsomal dipeptidase-like Zn-dependent dipeptidase